MADNSDISEIDLKLARLEGRLDELSGRIPAKPEEKPEKSWLSWELARNLVWLVAVPGLLLSGWQTIKHDIIEFADRQRAEAVQTAVANLETLQEMNRQVFLLQARQDDAGAFAEVEANRGRVERVTRSLYEIWQEYPDSLTPFEATTFAEALLSQNKNDLALDVIDSIDQSGMNEIQRGDMDILRARVLFSAGPAQDPEAARQAYRDAMVHAETLQDERAGAMLMLMEKYAGVRLINELWLGTDCADVTVFAGFLTDLVEDDADGLVVDAVRENTKVVLEGYDLRCGDAS
ncbi:MAG: hypothetical protein V2I76_14175 [Roseobacter sp.]|jgi:hypothetical protein|nr:hypothetical protein [Roseobacter sp.]